jgi:predicted ATP-binding protein involved in virulence
LSSHGKEIMGKTELLKIIEKLLKPDVALDFLLDLPEKHLETLVGCIRDRINQLSNKV